MHSGADPPDEELNLGRSGAGLAERLRRVRWPWWLALLAAVAVAVAVPLALSGPDQHQTAAAQRTGRPASSNPVPAITVTTPAPVPRRPVVTTLGHPVLGVHARWELFGRGERALVRIQFALGRVTTTPVPPVASSGPVYFVAGEHAALIHPLDSVQGYLVRDGRGVAPQPASLNCGGPLLPGPGPEKLWGTPCAGPANALALLRLPGRGTGPVLTVPPHRSLIEALPDQQGFAVFPGYAGHPQSPTVDVRPSGPVRIAAGRLVGIGPTRWIVERCPWPCPPIVIDRRTRAEHPLGAAARNAIASGGDGMISPDGRIAAVPTPQHVLLVDLRTGAVHPLAIRPDVTDLQTLVWSPDSRELFVVDRRGRLWAVNPAGRQLQLTNSLHLPRLRQVAIRG